MGHVSPVLNQTNYLFRNDNGSLTTATAIGTQNNGQTIDVDTVFRLRISVGETAGGASNNFATSLEYSLNGGGYTAVGATTPVQYAASANVTDGTATAQLISSGTFIGGEFDSNGTVNTYSFAGNDSIEMEYGLTIDSAQVADNDTINVRIAGLNAWTNVAAITVNEVTVINLVPQNVSHTHTAGSPTISISWSLTAQSVSHTHTAENVTIVVVITLVPQSVGHVHTAENVDITISWLVVVNDASHSHTAGSPTIAISWDLSANNSTHVHTAESPTIVVVINLVADNSSHVHTAGSPTISIEWTLAPANVSHIHSAEAALIEVIWDLIAQNSSHIHTAENVDITVVTTLVPDNVSHIHTAESPAISIEWSLVPSDVTHVHTADNVDIAVSWDLVPQNVSHVHTAENVTIDSNIQLVAQNSTHIHTAESPTISLSYDLVVDNVSHSHTAESPAISISWDLTPANVTHVHTAEATLISVEYNLLANSASHLHTSGSVSLTLYYDLVPENVTHIHTAPNVTIGTDGTLVVQSVTHAHTADNVDIWDDSLRPLAKPLWDALHDGCRVPINDSPEDGAEYHFVGNTVDREQGSVGKAVYETHIVQPNAPTYPDNATAANYALNFTSTFKYLVNDMLYGKNGDARNIIPGNALAFRGYPTPVLYQQQITLEDPSALIGLNYSGTENLTMPGSPFINISASLSIAHPLPYDLVFEMQLYEGLNPEDTVQVRIAAGSKATTHVRTLGSLTWTALTRSKVWFSRSSALLSGDITYQVIISHILQIPYYGTLTQPTVTVTEAEYGGGGLPGDTETVFWTAVYDWSQYAYEARVATCNEMADFEINALEQAPQLYKFVADPLIVGTRLYKEVTCTVPADGGTYTFVQYSHEFFDQIENVFRDIFTIKHFIILDSQGYIIFIETNIPPGWMGNPCWFPNFQY